MKAVVIDRFGGPKVLRYCEVPKPAPNADEILVRNEYIGVGKPDFLVRTGKDTLLAGKFPNLVIGNECAGIIESSGSEADGQSLYISGAAGGIGTALIQTALLQGMNVVASASTDTKCEYLRKLGAQCVFNYKKESEKEVILDYTGGRGVDLIYDQRAGKRFEEQFSYLADFGMILLYNWLEGCFWNKFVLSQ